MKTVMFFICITCFVPLIAQPNISGRWLGTITQNEGGFRSSYDFELYLHQESNQIMGRSYVYVEKIHAEMKLKGTVQTDGTIQLTEITLIDFKEFEGMEWCIKKMILSMNHDTHPWTLEGDWVGKTSFSSCTPGKIFLKKIVPRT